MKFIKNDDESLLSHTKWNCQYHIVFTPKYRRKAIYNQLRKDIETCAMYYEENKNNIEELDYHIVAGRLKLQEENN